MSLYTFQHNVLLGENSEVASALLNGETVVNKSKEERESEHYSCWFLEGEEQRCIRVDYVPPEPGESEPTIRYRGDDHCWAQGFAVNTPGIQKQMKESEEWRAEMNRRHFSR